MVLIHIYAISMINFLIENSTKLCFLFFFFTLSFNVCSILNENRH